MLTGCYIGWMSRGTDFPPAEPRLLQLHLHDNRGVNDDHLPVGEGIIDYAPVLGLLDRAPAISITLEAHDPDQLQRSLANFQALRAKEPPP